jgi:hypothetical protein
MNLSAARDRQDAQLIKKSEVVHVGILGPQILPLLTLQQALEKKVEILKDDREASQTLCNASQAELAYAHLRLQQSEVSSLISLSIDCSKRSSRYNAGTLFTNSMTKSLRSVERKH